MDNSMLLMGSSVSPLEMDDEELEGIQEDSSLQYDISEIIDSIGTSNFKEIYLNFINIIKGLTLPKQRDVGERITEKIAKIYEYEFAPKLELDNQLTLNDLYEFLEFIHYDCLSFLSDVWKFLKVELRGLDIEEYGIKNSMKIISEIEDQLESRDLNELITIFLRTYYKDGIIKWFIGISEKNRMLIVLRMLEGVNYDKSE